jgi:hypothetical protein
MKILLLHPSDTLSDGPWSQYRWDLVIDLGVSSTESAAYWSRRLNCRVLQLQSFRRRDEDFQRIREILNSGCGNLSDRQGLDWWRILSILLHEQLDVVLMARRLAADVGSGHQVYSSRWDWPVSELARALGCKVHPLRGGARAGLVSTLYRYGRAVRRLSFAQMQEVAFDKYDGHYRLRRRLHRSVPVSTKPIIVVPSAYTNVSRMAAEYARMVPEQKFLLVATRQSALAFDVPDNVSLLNLGTMAQPQTDLSESRDLLAKWKTLLPHLRAMPELDDLFAFGALEKFPALLRQGLTLRNAWTRVLSHQPVTAVFCGDDSNPTTRLAVEIAALRGIRTIDFHHGALDGRFLFKTVPSDLYLAKSEMEKDYLVETCSQDPGKIVLGAPKRQSAPPSGTAPRNSQIVFFSEPYENNAARPQEIYGEIIPLLAELARHAGTRLVIKLHPFESKGERRRLLSKLLSQQDLDVITLMSGPMPKDLASTTWFGVTVESTAALDCAFQGVTCFLCSWLEISPYGYVQQYARFGIGRPLNSANEIRNIPRMLVEQETSLDQNDMWVPISAERLQEYLTGRGKDSAPAAAIVMSA